MRSTVLYFSRPVRELLGRFSIILLFVLAMAGIFISKSDSSIAYSIRSKIIDVVSPITSAASKPFANIKTIGDNLSSYLFVRKRNEELIRQNKILRKNLIDLMAVSSENKSMVRLLNYTQYIDYKYISTSVVGDVSDPFISNIIINSGKRHGVRKGQALVNESGLIGRVIEVGETSARVMLLNDINSKIPVISNLSRERAILAGNNTDNPKLLYIQTDSPLARGEVLITSGDGKLIPPGLHIGELTSADAGKYKVSIFAKWHELEHVSVIDYGSKK